MWVWSFVCLLLLGVGRGVDCGGYFELCLLVLPCIFFLFLRTSTTLGCVCDFLLSLMSGELEVPWQESFALYPEKREQLVGSLLPSDDDFYFYSIVLQLSRLQPGDGLPKETVDLLARLKKRGYMAPRFKQLQTRCELIEMQAKGTSEKRVAELKKKFGKEVGVTLLHDPPHVEGKEREKKYKSVMKLKTLQEWKDIATKFSAVVCFFPSSFLSSSHPFFFCLLTLLFSIAYHPI